MDVRGTAAGTARLTKRSGRTLGGRAAPLAAVGIGIALIALALARLDPVYHQVPGVFNSGQLAPIGLDLRRDFADVKRDLTDGAPEVARPSSVLEQPAVAGLTAALERFSKDVEVVSWPDGSQRIVAVGVAEVENAQALAAGARARSAFSRARLPPRTTARVWAVEDRFLVALTVTGGPAAARAAVADASVDEVEGSIGVSRLFWWEVISLGPFLLVLLLAGAVYLGVLLLWMAFLVLKVLVYLVVLLPLGLLGLYEPSTRPPPPTTLRQDPFGRLAAGVERIDLDSLPLPGHGAVAWFTALVLALAVAIPSLATSLWTASLVWGALGAGLALIWLGRGAKGGWGILAAWAVAAVAAVELAHLFFGLGPGLPTESLAALALALLFVCGAITVAWRRAAAPGLLPSYVPWHADLDVRSAAYLAALVGIVLAGGALLLGSNGDFDPFSQVTSKALAVAGLLAVPFVGRRLRAARDAARREWARGRGVPEVLLLRSFVDDGLEVPSRPTARRSFERLIPARRELFEDVVVRAFTQLGPVMAIGKPGTGQSELGASRDLILGSDWLAVVKAEMADAAYIVVLLGQGEGLTRELETLRELELLDRVCLVVPPVDSTDAAERLELGTAEVDGPEGWGLISADHALDPMFSYRSEVLALLGSGERRFIVVSKQRDATAYLRLGAFAAGQLRRPAV